MIVAYSEDSSDPTMVLILKPAELSQLQGWDGLQAMMLGGIYISIVEPLVEPIAGERLPSALRASDCTWCAVSSTFLKAVKLLPVERGSYVVAGVRVLVRAELGAGE